MRVFVDTSALFAALVANDRMHFEARPLMARLLDEGAGLITTCYVLVETCALLQARVGLPAVRDFERGFRPALEVLWVDETLHARALARLLGQERRRLSLVDCVSFAAMESLRLRTAFAYDEHFGAEGFRVLAAESDLRGSR